MIIKILLMSAALALSISGAYAGDEELPPVDHNDAAARACDPGFQFMGPKIGCVGEALTKREDIAAFDRPHTRCKPGETVEIERKGKMPNGRLVIWTIHQHCVEIIGDKR